MRKPALIGLTAAGTVLLATITWCFWLNVPPTADIPAPKLPSPNGFDALWAASKLDVREKELGQAVSTHSYKGSRLYSLAEKAALVSANQLAIAAARRAVALPYADPPDPTGERNFKTFMKFRALAQLFVLDGQVKRANGDTAGAVQSDIDAVAIGIAVPRGGALTAQLIGVTCEAIGEQLVWHEIDKLDSAGAAAAATRLDAVLAQRYPYADTIRQEKWSNEASLVKEYRHKSALGLFTEEMKAGAAFADTAEKVTGSAPPDTPDGDSGIPASMMLYAYKYYATHSKRQIVADYAALMDAYAAQTERPFTSPGSEISMPTDPLSQFEFPLLKPARLRDVQMRMQGGLLTCALALRAYRLQHGDYPATLSDLATSGILKRLPNDPFARSVGTPFGYRRVSAARYILYSAGPDGIDDGGRPVPPLTNSFSGLQATDKGDWVVGVNIGKPTAFLPGAR